MRAFRSTENRATGQCDPDGTYSNTSTCLSPEIAWWRIIDNVNQSVNRQRPEFLNSEPSDWSVAADALLREEPDEAEEDDEDQDDGNDDDDEDEEEEEDDGYSE